MDYRHLAASCPSLVKITIIDGTPTEAIELDSEEYIYDPGDAETDEEFTSDDVGSIVLIKHHQLICLLLDVPPHNLPERMIGEKMLSFTDSLKLEIRIIR